MKTSVALVTDIVQPTVEALGLELWGVEHIQQGRYSVLRIFIDNEDTVNLTDCEKVSRQISALLDVEDPISGEYTLEVSSPGLERPLFKLDQFAQYIGDEVKIKLRDPLEGRRKFTGVIECVSEDTVSLNMEGKTLELEHAEIEKASIVNSERIPTR
ncbi:MAG: ribosome maturation factor RimP [Rhodospirillaceae bacterium]|nr:ribosome maturation factor RimP [Rhodospirillaceae bacterium]